MLSFAEKRWQFLHSRSENSTVRDRRKMTRELEAEKQRFNECIHKHIGADRATDSQGFSLRQPR